MAQKWFCIQHIYEFILHLISVILHWYTTSLHTRYRLVGKSTPHLVSYVETVERAGQLHLREMSRARLFKPNMS